ncbi:acyl-CoA thioesterase [Rhodococcoides yunnanense]|uniref:Hotdog domain-containing protein n=1 Tax=Rhodococcoides yunnanense TaxID=278209 RepID=A0ABU4BKH2_9NOCA|nr:hotdog domain-containing protein [Rhodococcus yunnanensis]MDV6264710.1 hotdog domain-containing protein [Rhodococcus yunnanensis]
MKVYTGPIVHRPERDGSVVENAHVPFFLAMEYSAAAWRSWLVEACGDLLTAGDLGVVDVSAQFSREMFVGEVSAEVALVRLGSSSLAFRVVLQQDGVVCAVITNVLVRLAPDRKKSLPLSAEQRAVLGELLDETRSTLGP